MVCAFANLSKASLNAFEFLSVVLATLATSSKNSVLPAMFFFLFPTTKSLKKSTTFVSLVGSNLNFEFLNAPSLWFVYVAKSITAASVTPVSETKSLYLFVASSIVCFNIFTSGWSLLSIDFNIVL